MLAAMVTTTILIAVCVLVHYEALRIASDLVPHLRMPPRPRILVVMGAAFLAHTIEIWVFAVAYYVLRHHLGIGSVEGITDDTFPELLYFSTVTYTSLGFGDIYPTGGLRMVAGVEALVGLLLIGWSASFTYLEMRRYWETHPTRWRHPDAGKNG